MALTSCESDRRTARILPAAPPPQHAIDILPDMISRFPTLDAARQKRVVAGFRVADMRGDRELHRVLIEAFGGGRPADTPAVLLARVVRDALSAIRWAPWEQLAYPLREPRHEFGIELGPPFRLPLAAPGACLRVVQALGLGALERVFLDEQSLALVPLARATPFQHHGGQRRVLTRAARQRSIARRQKQEVIEIRTREAERAPDRLPERSAP